MWVGSLSKTFYALDVRWSAEEEVKKYYVLNVMSSGIDTKQIGRRWDSRPRSNGMLLVKRT